MREREPERDRQQKEAEQRKIRFLTINKYKYSSTDNLRVVGYFVRSIPNSVPLSYRV